MEPITPTGPCPLCGAPRPYMERYPDAVCRACVARTADPATGRPVGIYNTSILGTGVIAFYEDVDAADPGREAPLEERDYGLVAAIDGRAVLCREHRFGGIVVQPLRSSP